MKRFYRKPQAFPFFYDVKRRAFTLVELLAVISIILLLIAFSTAGLKHMASSSLNKSGNSLVDLIKQARQVAVTHRSLTALVLVTDSDDSAANWRTLCICELKQGAVEWKQITSWERISEHVIIDQNQSASFLEIPSIPVDAFSLRYAQNELSNDQFYFQVFLPNGGLLKQDKPPTILMRPSTGNLDNYYKVVMNPSTGVPIIERP